MIYMIDLMYSKLKVMLDQNDKFIRFIIVGILNSGLSYFVYCFFLLWFDYLYSYTITFILAVLQSYFLNLKVVFQAQHEWTKLVKFPLVYGAQYLVGLAFMRLLVGEWGLSEVYAPLVVVLVTVPFTFVLSRYVLGREGKT